MVTGHMTRRGDDERTGAAVSQDGLELTNRGHSEVNFFSLFTDSS